MISMSETDKEDSPRSPAHPRESAIFPILYLLSGWLFSRFVLTLFRFTLIDDYVFLPGLAAAILMVGIMIRCLIGLQCPAATIYFIAGIVVDSVFFWTLRSGNSQAFVDIRWAPRMFLLSFCGLVPYIAIIAALKSPLAAGKTTFAKANLINTVLICSAMGITILLFRVIYLLTSHIPNDERSMMIAGVEIHHAVLGALVICLLAVLMAKRKTHIGTTFCIFFGSASGFILDQVSYLPILDLTDAAYNSRISWLGAATGAAAYVAYVMYEFIKNNRA